MEVLLEKHGVLRITHEEELTMAGGKPVEEWIGENHRIFPATWCGEAKDGVILTG